MNMFSSVLSNDPLLWVPTNPKELADLIYDKSMDWAVVLDFLDKAAKSKGIEIDTRSTSNLIQDKIMSEDPFCLKYLREG